MFGTNDNKLMEMLESIYLVISRAFNAFFKFVYALYQHD